MVMFNFSLKAPAKALEDYRHHKNKCRHNFKTRSHAQRPKNLHTICEGEWNMAVKLEEWSAFVLEDIVADLASPNTSQGKTKSDEVPLA